MIFAFFHIYRGMQICIQYLWKPVAQKPFGWLQDVRHHLPVHIMQTENCLHMMHFQACHTLSYTIQFYK